jgi:prepilin-type N-terminal cleavage/methylation domain-containing protein
MESFRIRRDLAAPLNVSAGFTLIELMVVLAIIVTMTMIVLTNQNTFNKTLVLANTAYDIALTLRSAETFGLGSRATVVGVSNAGYGIHFENAPTNSFTLFADTSPPANVSNCHGLPLIGGASAPDAQFGDCKFTSGLDQRVNNADFKLGNAIIISNFCVFPVVGAWSCASTGLTSLDIVFSRPNPDAFMSRGGAYDVSLTKACIVVSSPQGGTPRYITVAKSGQIIANADHTACGL